MRYFTAGFILALCASTLLAAALASGIVVIDAIDRAGERIASAIEQDTRPARPVPHVPADYVPPGTPEPDPVLVRERMLPYTQDELDWMQLNIYFEARNQVFKDQVAIAHVVLNRVADRRYPDTVEEVITKARLDRKGNPIRNQCHFSWYCDGLPDDPYLNNRFEREAWEEAGRVAHLVLAGQVDDPTDGALYYHAPSASPSWARPDYATVSLQVGHIFYTRN